MILVDTAIWIDHLRSEDAVLSHLLGENRIVGHPFVFGELALGLKRDRAKIRHLLGRLRVAVVARDAEVLSFIDNHHLQGTGIGYIDAHLLVSAKLTVDSSLWTRDKRLRAVAERLSLAAKLAH